MDRTFLHVDMDAFFAAVEQRDNPELKGKPVVVGSPPDKRGVVSTCSYEAREFGIHSAMPSRTAYQKCPHAIFLPVRSQAYKDVSDQVFEIFSRFSPDIEKLSIDEAFIDITGSMHLFGGARETAEAIRAAIRDELSLTASVGLAPNKYLAKLASDMNKPDGLTEVPREAEAIKAFLAPLPVKRIWGVGKKSAQTLLLAGIHYISDIQKRSEKELIDIMGESMGRHIYRLAFGLDERAINPGEAEKSISKEHTFSDDEKDWDKVEKILIKLAENVGQRLRKKTKKACTTHIKLRWSSFETITRQISHEQPLHNDRDLIKAALELFNRERCEEAVRLVGFGVSKLYDEDAPVDYQPDLFADQDDLEEKNDQLDAAVDAIREQFGSDSLKRGN